MQLPHVCAVSAHGKRPIEAQSGAAEQFTVFNVDATLLTVCRAKSTFPELNALVSVELSTDEASEATFSFGSNCTVTDVAEAVDEPILSITETVQ